MSLVSPGVQVDIIDESVGSGASNGTVPLIVLATEKDKLTPAGSEIAEGTTDAYAGKLQLFTSQREILQAMGNPKFHKLGGTSLHGYELNEYGLLAAHSYLGSNNRVYVVRAPIDLAELQPLDEAPTGAPQAGTHWLNLNGSRIGISIYDGNTGSWVPQEVEFIADARSLDANGVPLSSIEGDIGQYVCVAGVVAGAATGREENRIFRRTASGWELLDTSVISEKLIFRSHTKPPFVDEMASMTVSAQGSGYSVGDRIGLSETAGTGRLLMVDVTGVDSSGAVTSFEVVSYGRDYSGTGIVSTQTSALQSNGSPSAGTGFEITGDTLASGDIWIKTSEPDSGTSFDMSLYDASVSQWIELSVPVHMSRDAATKAGSTPVAAVYDFRNEAPGTGTLVADFAIMRHNGQGETVVEGTVTAPTIGAGSTLTINGYDVVLTGTDVASAVVDITNASIPDIKAKHEGGKLYITNKKGYDIKLVNTAGTPTTDLGLENTSFSVTGGFVHSNWDYLDYVASDNEEPFQNPSDGTLWYSENFGADILVNNGAGSWEEFQGTVYMQPALPQIGIVRGDLWIDTDQIEDYPVMYRYNGSSWDKIDPTDQTTSSGIVFADARPSATFGSATGANNGNLVGAPDLDADAPDPLLYARDMLLFNTRASSHVVKAWVNEHEHDGVAIGGRWVLESGLRTDGSAFFGRHAVKRVIIESMASAIVSNEVIRAESVEFNLMAAPGFPELSDELLALNADRKYTAFIPQDAPFRLAPKGTEIEAWANNRAGSPSNDDAGLVTFSRYIGVFYPGCAYATNVDGEEVVVPITHSVLRTYAENDSVSYPWFAAAFSRRGVITNATSVGYIDGEGEYSTVELSEGLRDVLYTNKVNPVAYIPNSGLEIYGNKSLYNLASSLDRINVVRLENYLRQNMPGLARPFLGEQNDRLTRDQVLDVFERYMETLITLRAIEDYVVICDESNNTPARRDRNELWIDVAVIPLKTVEFIYIPVRFRNSGDSLNIN